MKTHLVLTVQFQADMPSTKCNVCSLKEEYDVFFFSLYVTKQRRLIPKYTQKIYSSAMLVIQDSGH